MALPAIVEYLLSLEKPGNNLVFSRTIQIDQTLTPVGTAGATFNAGALLGQNYAYIVYRTVLDPLIVPNALLLDSVFFGNAVFSGLITRGVIDNPLDTFAVQLKNHPALFTVRNTSALNQRFFATLYFLSIPTEENWNEVLEVLNRNADSRFIDYSKQLDQIIALLKTPTPGAIGRSCL